MRHLKRGNKLKRTPDERKALLRQLANALILHNQIVTTAARARAVRPLVERLVTRGKESESLANRRYVLRFLTKEATGKVFKVIGPKYKTRPGGYTRITKLSSRAGDSAKMVKIELI